MAKQRFSGAPTNEGQIDSPQRHEGHEGHEETQRAPTFFVVFVVNFEIAPSLAHSLDWPKDSA
jgi:hypothetical protein